MSKRKEELERELLLLKIKENKEEQAKVLESVISQLTSMINKCYIKYNSRGSRLIYRILGVKSKTYSQGNHLINVILKLDKVLHLHLSEKKFNKHSVVFNYFQDNPYGELQEQVFSLDYCKDSGVFEFTRSFNGFMRNLKEISTEQYEDILSVGKDNETKTEELISKYNIN